MGHRFFLCVALLAGSFFISANLFADDGLRGRADKLYRDGNYKEALAEYRKLLTGGEQDEGKMGYDLERALACLTQLGSLKDIDELRESALGRHGSNRYLLLSAAESLMNNAHHGFLISGEFERGGHRGGGKAVNAVQRDRVRALQLMVQSMPLVERSGSPDERYSFYQRLASMLLFNRGYSEAWRLQVLTDLVELPDYEDGYGHHFHWYGGMVPGAPVDRHGNPVFYSVPSSFESAMSDGQRWRWCLAMAEKAMPQNRATVQRQLADFLRQQFGVQTMASYGYIFGGGGDADVDPEKDKAGPYAVHTLGDDEAMARLAVGIRRFHLPDEFNYLRIYRKIADGEDGRAESALQILAEIYTNRRQYPMAAQLWRESIKRFGPGRRNSKQQQLDQIVGNWGQFERGGTVAAGQESTVRLRFRNAGGVALTAHRLDIDKLLADVKDYLKSNPRELDWKKLQIDNIGWLLVNGDDREKYIGEEVVAWQEKLQPAANHWDRTVSLRAPLKDPGAYLVTAKLADGNVCRIVVWISDTVIVRKQIDGGTLYFLADATSGKPVAEAQIELFGYRQEWVQRGIGNALRRYQIHTREMKLKANADGLATLTKDQLGEDGNSYQWLAAVKTGDGRFAYLGFRGQWVGNYRDSDYNQRKVFVITDRPVYRPEQNVEFKFWVRQAKYDQEDVSAYANRSFTVVIRNPKNEEIHRQGYTADAFGGFSGSISLPEDAALGVYRVYLDGFGGGSFRVEEYKKPEYEVSIEAPEKPVALGEKINARIMAKYYFGAPVTQATVKYKVLRTSQDEQWFPVRPWRWLYGTGYWWFAPDYDWYPGWNNWACRAPVPWWWNRRPDPPELVMEGEAPIGADGTLDIPIDTALAKAFHGDTDHKYEITAEVVDMSRRTIVGKGNVIAAREPFKVYTWLDRGHYRVGDKMEFSASARTAADKPVEGQGDLRLLALSYDRRGLPVEKELQRWSVKTDSEGLLKQEVKAHAPGQYRFSCRIRDAAGHEIEGGYVFCISGEGFAGAGFRFNDLELIPDKPEYGDGDTVKLMLNTAREDATVLFFTRPVNGVCKSPEILRMNGRSVLEEITVTKKDMPNFFVEAVTISNGKVFTVAKEIVVPPEKRILNVEVLPTDEKYKPGETAKVKVRISDLLGHPVDSTAVISVYDRAVEYISGGSNVPEIKEFFWKWRRRHYPRTESSLQRDFSNLQWEREKAMASLGIFGHISSPDDDDMVFGAVPGGGRRGMARDGAAMMMEAAPMAMKSMADSAEMESAGAAPARGAEAGEAETTVRQNFADTAYWQAVLTPNSDGIAEVEIPMPENLTAWKISVWALAHGTKVGQGTAEVVTAKDLILRLQAPRFLIEKDEVVLSANIHNYLGSAKRVRVVLEQDGKCLALPLGTESSVNVPAGGEKRVDWRVKALSEGDAVVRMKAFTDEESDAMQVTLPVYVHGMLKTVSWSGGIRPEENSTEFTFDVPAERRPGQSVLELRYSPTLAGAMVDALPYLVSYPYGCTEQTLNRFLPTVITRKVLNDMGLDLSSIKTKQSNLNAQEIGEDKERAKQWKKWKTIIGYDRAGQPVYSDNPVYDERLIDDMVESGVKRLLSMQLSDGGWGWFSGWGERSYPHTTAVVVHGLQVAVANGVKIDANAISRGIKWLADYQNEQLQRLRNAPGKTHPYKLHADNLDALVFRILTAAKLENAVMCDFLYRDRNHLSLYGKALFGLALHKLNEQERLDMVVRNIEQYLVIDDENQTAYLKMDNGGYWWFWYGSEIEAHAAYLQLLAAREPKSAKAAGLVKYLLNNRKHATYWNSTRDTAYCIEAFADYIRAAGEDKPDMTLDLLVDGKIRKTVSINAANLFCFDNKLILKGQDIATGKHRVEIRRKGTGPVYANGYFTYFSLEDPIKKTGLEIKVQRRYFRLKKVDKESYVRGDHGQALRQKVEKYEREPLADLAMVKSGDLLEVELLIESKNDYEYLVFEDMKAAGSEPVDLRSGYTGNEMGAYVEFRDEKVCFFVRRLARGRHSVSYRIRAEIPGRFSALPTKGSAMYAPELKANSDEFKLQIQD